MRSDTDVPPASNAVRPPTNALEKELSAPGIQPSPANGSANGTVRGGKELGLAEKAEAGGESDDHYPDHSLESLDEEERAAAAVQGGGGAGPPVRKIESVNNVASIPNGGLLAWLQVAGAFVLFLNTWYVPSKSSGHR